MKLFLCRAMELKTPDMSNASRRMKRSEFKQVLTKMVFDSITEVLVGYDGIVIANSKSSKQIKYFLQKSFFLALAKDVTCKKMVVKKFGCKSL